MHDSLNFGHLAAGLNADDIEPTDGRILHVTRSLSLIFTTLLIGRASEAGAPFLDDRALRAHACKRAHFRSDVDNTVTDLPSIGNRSYGII